MLSLKPVLFLLLTLVCLGVSKVTPHQKQQLSTAVVYGGHGVFPVRIETGSNGEEDSSSMILAEKRTRRKDPANHLKYYDGGWNISDHHYKSSVLYTAAPLFGIAAVWFVGFGLSLLSICFCYCCCRRTPYGYSRTAYALSLAFLALFTIAAIVGCVILYTGQGKFHNSTTDTLDFVVSESKDTINELNNVSEILATSKNIGVDQVSLPPSMKQNIDRVDEMVSKAVRSLDSETQKNEKDIHDVLNSVRLALIIVAAIMLLVALLGFLLSIFGLQVLVYILVVLGWILVTATFILCGIFLTLHKYVPTSPVSKFNNISCPLT
ncbi:putative transmembrane protein [Helianthus annuus]|nr:putative transmembrane protein [Helianthus annuus]